MKKKFLLIAFFILIAMLALPSSCNKQPAEQAEDAMTPYGRYENTLKVTIAKHDSPITNFPDGMSMYNNPYFDILKDKLNIEVEIVWVAAVFDSQLALCIMTGDIPDLCYVSDHLQLKLLAENDLIQPLDGLFEACMNDWAKQNYATFGDDIFKPSTFNGKQMALPGTANVNQRPLLWVRKDWLDALNLQPPKTLDEIINVAQQFMQKDPGGNGPGNTIGINCYREWAFQGYANQYGMEPICYSYGAYPAAWVFNDSGEAVYGSVQPEMKEALRKIRSMFETGILDPECFYQGWEEVWGNVNEGKTGLFFTVYTFPNSNLSYATNNPEGELLAYPAPLDANGKNTYVTTASTTYWYTVRKGFDHPEALYKILNVCLDAHSGRDPDGYALLQPVRDRGTDWTYVIPTGRFNITNTTGAKLNADRIREYLETGIVGEDWEWTDLSVANTERIRDWMEGRSKDPTDWARYATSYVASYNIVTPEDNVIVPAYSYKTDIMIDKWDSLQILERSMYRGIMTGEMPIDYFDEFVTQWYEMGGREITAEVNAVINAP